MTIIRVGAGFDSGPIALRERSPIEPDEDYGSLSARLAELGGELIVRALDLRASGELEFAEQDESVATYAEKIAPDERRLDPRRPAIELERTVRALNPHLGAYLELDGGERLGVARRRGRGRRGGARPAGGRGRGAAAGLSRGVLRLGVVQPAGGRPMAADAYLRGHPLPRLSAGLERGK